MSIRDTTWPAGTPCWVDLAVPDVPKAVEFYSGVIGWSLVDSGEEFGHYHIAQVEGHAAAGVGPTMAEGQPSFWTLYIASDDTDATAKLVTENGGSVIMEPMDVPGAGRMCIAADPTGGVFGIWQSLGMPGAAIVNEPGGIAWEDARLTDVEAGRAFYTAVFGWTYGEIPGMELSEYGTFHGGGDPLGGLGGLMGAPEGTPSHWVVYFGTADVDAAVAAVERLGGGVTQPAVDTPYGRMAFVTDPFGAPFALHQAPQG
jgi:predicted enzyme related to lactoylglutathione lyase